MVQELNFYCFRSVFNFNALTLDYQQYIMNWVIGSRRFLLKLNDNTIAEAKRTYHFLFWLDFIVKTLFYAGVSYLAYSSFPVTSKIE